MRHGAIGKPELQRTTPTQALRGEVQTGSRAVRAGGGKPGRPVRREHRSQIPGDSASETAGEPFRFFSPFLSLASGNVDLMALW